MNVDPEHPTLARRSGYRYVFLGKHHGGGSKSDSRWLPDITRDEEFSVFDHADVHNIADDRDYLYGVHRTGDGELRDLGTWRQQVAEFPRANEGIPWHGYPIWAVNDDAPANRSGQKTCPSKEVFRKMEQAKLITSRQRKRLIKGGHV